MDVQLDEDVVIGGQLERLQRRSSLQGERICVELMTSDRKIKASRERSNEGSTGPEILDDPRCKPHHTHSNVFRHGVCLSHYAGVLFSSMYFSCCTRQFYIETPIIYELGSREFTTQNDIHPKF